MAWTTPAQRNTGDLITSSIWNTDLKDNLRYLKGMDGQITLEDDIIPDGASQTIGEFASPWHEGYFDQLYTSPGHTVNRAVREVAFDWEGDTMGDYQIDIDTPGAAQVENGGYGQIVFIVNDDGAESARIKGMDQQNNAYDTSFNASRSPYYRQGFVVNHNVSNTGIFIGLRQTPGAALPDYSAENYFGMVWSGTDWRFASGNASSLDLSAAQSISANTRYVFEVLLIASTSVVCYLNGTYIDTLTVVPTGDLEFAILLESDGLGGGTDTILTIEKSLMQESLS